MNATTNDPMSEIERTNWSAIREAISFWFAISSPLSGLIIGFLGAWFYTWLRS